MSTILHLLRGQMSSPVNHLGGQMSSYTIFHRGADVREGKCPAPIHNNSMTPSIVNCSRCIF